MKESDEKGGEGMSEAKVVTSRELEEMLRRIRSW